MKHNDTYTNKVADYIKQEYGEDLFTILLREDVADTAIMALIIHEQAGIPVQDTAATIAKYLKSVRGNVMNEVEFKTFDSWWVEVAEPRMNHYIDGYLDENPDYTEDDVEDYTDSGCVHRMIHEGETSNMLWEICQEVFDKGYNGEDWQLGMSDSLFCELDDIIQLSYEAGQRYGSEA